LPPDGSAFTIATIPHLFFESALAGVPGSASAAAPPFPLDSVDILYVLAYSASCLVVRGGTGGMASFTDFQAAAEDAEASGTPLVVAGFGEWSVHRLAVGELNAQLGYNLEYYPCYEVEACLQLVEQKNVSALFTVVSSVLAYQNKYLLKVLAVANQFRPSQLALVPTFLELSTSALSARCVFVTFCV
jgi:tripartite-type tricarboxylate transporter receptor subunit TctC